MGFHGVLCGFMGVNVRVRCELRPLWWPEYARSQAQGEMLYLFVIEQGIIDLV